ncbi:hypothetical protein BDV41DRAFT_552541 [Aspergillus transmontanensis]|uniref:Uncharacterized protein n=1 Tax=Aspergillus transmontanensis TaxID=1034304 RepID=A0A5N6VIS4_9EURO|nr:hypothetical protein BDV41DRAFT_552541 [Aspergillus transmontanensis]
MTDTMREAIKPVKIPGIAWDIAADIHFPPNFDETKKICGCRVCPSDWLVQRALRAIYMAR